MTNYYLVLIETSGNQNFIFSTNKLKENIGASELTYQAGTFWVGWAVDQVNGQKNFKKCSSSEEFREALKNQSKLEETPNQVAEILVGASGKALILTRSKEIAKKIINAVTKRALIKAPGLDVAGVYVEIQNWDSPNTLHKAVKEVHKEYEKVRSRRPSPLNRFLRLPIIADCAVSELPASELESLTQDQRREGKQPKAISVVSSVKRDAAQEAVTRLTKLDERLQASIDRLLKDEDNDSERKSWLAIVHADGNGLGQIFLNFEDYIGENKSNRNYIDKYRKFSLALDECTEAAFKKALDVFPSEEKQKNIAPIVPLIIGGDDLTVVCDGHYALEFTRVFLQEFERETSKKSEIAAIAETAFRVSKLSACAGIAIIKPHFPFSVAYNLAESLIKSAKEVKKKVVCIPTETIPENTPFPCSAIDFHILYDSSGVDFEDIRDRLKPEQDVLLHNRPYVVSEDLTKAEDDGQKWARDHDWSTIQTKIEELNRPGTDPKYNEKPKLARTQCGELRSALHTKKAAADAKYQLIRQRYHTDTFNESNDSLFYLDRESQYRTSFLDALDAMDFLKSDQDKNKKENAE